MRRAKIICTIGPASQSPEILEQLIQEGMNVARLNMSHGSRAIHHRTVTTLRTLASRHGSPLAILLDLQGPRIRVGELAQPIEILPGQTVRLVHGGAEPEHAPLSGTGDIVIPIGYEALTHDLHPGARVLIDDGLIQLLVERVDREGVFCRVVTGGKVMAHKGVNFPGIHLRVSTITDKDEQDVQFGLAHDVDYIALSFVRSAHDIQALRSLMLSQGKTVPIIAKIERPEAVENLDDILEQSDGVMVARGDLAIEMSPEDVPVLQKQIIRTANRRRRLVITATQMLESMTGHPTPTRAEATDVANAVFDGTDALMLSAETSIGRYPVDVLKVMDRIVRRAESAELTRLPQDGQDLSSAGSIPEAVCTAGIAAARAVKAKAIIAMTERGVTAQLVAAARPPMPVIALTPFESVRRRLAMVWGVVPYLLHPIANTDERIAAAVELVKSAEGIQAGDDLVVLTGVQVQQPGGTNLMKVQHVE